MAKHQRTTGIGTTNPVPINPLAALVNSAHGSVVVQADAGNGANLVLLGDPATLSTSSYGLALAAGASVVLPANASTRDLAALASASTVAVNVLAFPL